MLLLILGFGFAAALWAGVRADRVDAEVCGIVAAVAEAWLGFGADAEGEVGAGVVGAGVVVGGCFIAHCGGFSLGRGGV